MTNQNHQMMKSIRKKSVVRASSNVYKLVFLEKTNQFLSQEISS
ncbi:unnamed protein product [Onchocerca flexuosa]|uniref:Uncharacterized protein n=1 Tax=Onchocerca flexuosa TaxID=387005 RepID=A0A183HMM2_9BILA|nr:unnamed protein product [Onchocerca flexuosa]